MVRTVLIAIVVLILAATALWATWSTVDAPTVAEAQTGTDVEQHGTVVTVTRVVDGDTIDVPPAVQSVQRVRFIGVDTPEVSGEQEPGGQEAFAFTTEQLEEEQVALEFDEDTLDQYERALAYVWLPGGELFNETLVRQGYAEVATFEPNVKYEDRFLAAEEQARAEDLGIWGSGTEGTTSDVGQSPATKAPAPKTPATPPKMPSPAPKTPSPVPKTPAPVPDDGGTLMNAGGPTTGPVPMTPNGSCLREFSEIRDGACYSG